MADERIRIEIGFDGGQVMGAFVDETTADKLEQAIGDDRKGKVSLACYAAALALSPFVPWLSIALFVVVAIIWFLPDRRVERVVEQA